MMECIASNSRPGFKNGILFQYKFRAFRGRHRKLKFRAQEGEERIKQNAESYEHVDRFFLVLLEVEGQYPGSLANTNCIWNMDETVDGILCTKEKVFSAEGSNAGENKAYSSAERPMKNVKTFFVILPVV